MALNVCIFIAIFISIHSGIQTVTGKKTFIYTVNNELEEPFFTESIELTLFAQQPLYYYMVEAVKQDPTRFSSVTATYTPIFDGYFIDAINGQFGFWSINQTWWAIWNEQGLLEYGVSKYIPTPNDQIWFNFTQGWIPH